VALAPAHPNPLNPRTIIPFRLDAERFVHLAVHDLRGRRVRSLVDGRVAAGDHRVAWDGRDDGAAEVASGVYVVRLEAAGQVESRRVLVLK
jgi:flagellar hook assembly protein FlgD